MSFCRILTTGLCLLALLAGPIVADDPLPLGHPDFYPSDDRPVRLRGDGSGHFPASTPVTAWDFRTGNNIVWSTKLPSWGYSSPIVVGDKVFVTADFNRLLCLNARSGDILWERKNWTFDVVAPEKARADQLREKWNMLIGAHSEAWAVCWEIAYLTWKLDVIEAAQAGKEFEWPRGGYGHSGKVRRKGANMADMHLSDNEKKQLMASMAELSDAEIKKLRDRLGKLQSIREERAYGPSVSAYVPTLSPFRRKSKSPARTKWEKDIHPLYRELLEYGLATDFWNGYLGTSFPTPVSDGKHVYVNFGQNQVVCYDLQGNRKWIRVLFDPEKVGVRTAQNFSASPLLAGDLLISLHGNVQNEGPTMWAVNKETGKLVWSRPMPHHNAFGHPYAQMAHMKHGDIDVIACGNGTIVETRTGDVVVDKLITLCGPPLVHENVVYYLSGSGQAGDGLRCAVEISRNKGKLCGRMLWSVVPKKGRKFGRYVDAMARHMDRERIQSLEEAGEGATKVGSLWMNGKILLGQDPGKVLDPATGKVTETELHFRRTVETDLRPAGKHRGHLVRAGAYLFATGSSDLVACYDASVPTKVVGVGRAGSKWQREVQLQKISAEEMTRIIRERHFLPHYREWSTMQSTPFAQGDRLYLRTRDTLYCIGDPNKPYHSPKSTPEEARTGE